MIENECDEWRPPSVSSKGAMPDPTANAAIRYVDDIEGRIAALREEERELIDFVGDSLLIIQKVRDGLGVKYGDILEWRFIDCMMWENIRREYGVPRSTGYWLQSVALDWIDSVGVSRVIDGETEI